jgi:CBS domain-containing protein
MLSAVVVAVKSLGREHGGAHLSFAHATLADVVSTPRFGPFVPLSTTHSLLDAFLLLGKYGLRRLPVVQAGGDLVNILTQSRLLQLMVDNPAVLASVEGQSLASLGLGSERPVYAVSIAAPALAAFDLMQQHDVSAVAVVGHANELIGAVSCRDIRLLAGPGASGLRATLHHPLRMFLEALNNVGRCATQPAGLLFLKFI